MMSIPEIVHVIHSGRVNNDAKVSFHVRGGVHYLCIHKRRFTDVASALSYLREDARNIVAPENRVELKEAA